MSVCEIAQIRVLESHRVLHIRDLKQARTATAVRKQLNFTVKKQTTHNQLYLLLFFSDEGPMLETLDYTIRIGSTPTFLYFDLYIVHILWLKVCERTVLTVLKSFLSNVYQRQEGCRRAEDGKILIFTSSGRRQPSRPWKVLLKIDFKTVNTVFHKLLIIKYASSMQYVDVVSCLWFLFNSKI